MSPCASPASPIPHLGADAVVAAGATVFAGPLTEQVLQNRRGGAESPAGKANSSSPPGDASPPGSHVSGSVSHAGSVARYQLHISQSKELLDAGSSAAVLPPGSLGPKARWEWKLRQLTYDIALKGLKRYGRERKTGWGCADDAEKAVECNLADALRIRYRRHENCEMLALGGFMSRPFPKLQEERRDMKAFCGELAVQRAEANFETHVHGASSTKGANTGN